MNKHHIVAAWATAARATAAHRLENTDPLTHTCTNTRITMFGHMYSDAPEVDCALGDPGGSPHNTPALALCRRLSSSPSTMRGATSGPQSQLFP